MKINKKISIISILLIIIGIALIVSTVSTTEGGIDSFNYNIKRNVYSSVELLPNNFYDNNNVISSSYPANLINKINLNYVYNYSGNLSSNYSYSYNIKAYLVGNYNDLEVWRKEYDLLPTTEIKKGKSININDNISIDYQIYKNLVNQYNYDTNITTDSYLLVQMNINGSNIIDSSSENDDNNVINDKIEVKIPINNYVTSVENTYDKSSTGTYALNNKIDNNRLIIIVTGSVSILVAILLILYSLRNQELTQVEKYKRNVNQIEKDYSDLIVVVTNEPDVLTLKKMYIEKIEDMIDIADQNKVNIIQYEAIKNRKTNLYAIIGKYVYIYTITSKDIK